ncbi:MAG: signal peptide peptidase SppA [Nitrospinota bacterium]|nr:signal peptide peptidase SppA [Nitrospinota bacterium]
MLIIRMTLKFNMIICLLGFLISISLLGCATVNIGPSFGELKEKTIEGVGPHKILLVDIDGLINNHKDRSLTGNTLHLGMVEKIRSVIEKAEKDKNIKALLVKINSPGGTVTASDIIFHLFKEYKERTKVKIYMQVMDLAASGGYYIAISGDEIMAHPTSLIGSIGVIALKVNLKDLMTKIGVDWEIVKSGDKKDFMSPFRAFTKEEREIFQSTINKFHKRFVTKIANNRKGLNLSQVQLLADGRVFDAQEAKKFNLIDHISYLNGTVKKIKADLNNLNLKLVTYHRNEEFQGNIYSKLENPNIFNLINPYLDFNPNSLSPYFLYIWSP